MHLENKIEILLSCKVLQISRSGYYDWKNRPDSERALETARLVESIRSVHSQSRGIYGSPRIARALNFAGTACSENTIAKLMSENEIYAITKKKFKVVTTNSNHNLPIAPWEFKIEDAATSVMSPNQVWCGDLTYIATKEGWL